MNKILSHFTNWLRAFPGGLMLVVLLLLTGCGGGGDSTTDTTDKSSGEVVIGLTDAAGDFLTYKVDVKSLKLTHKNGTVVETLPNQTSVDFAQYVEVTEFLTTATVPSGVYTSVSMLLDYSNSQIMVEDENGDAKEAIAVNDVGNTLQELTVEVELMDSDIFIIRPGVPAHITLDFDLAASNEVDLMPTPAIVTVDPLLLADTLLEDPKSHRLRGLLKNVDTNADVFTVNIRPFHRRIGNYGTVRVHTLSDTAYEIDGINHEGEAGLAQLALMPTTTAIVALGELNRITRHFEAIQVYAGTSVPWGDKDVITGHVVARSGDLLTVRGATIVRSNNSVIFNDEISITVTDDTNVTRQGGSDEPLDNGDISVGQRITASGVLSDPAAAKLELDASVGHVRLLYTNLNGTVVQASPLVIGLQSIGRRRVTLFDFTGTGNMEDADPANYEIDTAGLTLSEIQIDDPVKIRGFVNAFGEAPPDFKAKTIVGVSDLVAHLLIHWDEGSTAPFSSSSTEAITVNLGSGTLGKLHHVFRAGIAIDLTSLGTDPTLQPDSDTRGLFAIAQNHRIQVFTDFANFEASLADRLDGVNVLDRIHGHGSFDDALATLTARRIAVRLP